MYVYAAIIRHRLRRLSVLISFLIVKVVKNIEYKPDDNDADADRVVHVPSVHANLAF